MIFYFASIASRMRLGNYRIIDFQCSAKPCVFQWRRAAIQVIFIADLIFCLFPSHALVQQRMPSNEIVCLICAHRAADAATCDLILNVNHHLIAHNLSASICQLIGVMNV